MNRLLINELNRQRQIMGLNPKLIVEDAGFGSIGDFFADFVKLASKTTQLVDELGDTIYKLGDEAINNKDLQVLMTNLRNGNYNAIDSKILDNIASLIKSTKNAEGTSYLDVLNSKIDESLKLNDPSFTFDEWVKRVARESNNGTRSFDESFNLLTNNNPLLSKILRDSLEEKVNLEITRIIRTATEAADEAARIERLKNENPNILERIRARTPGGNIHNWSNNVGMRYIYSFRWSPLTKLTQWVDLGKAIEAAASQFMDRAKAVNDLLDEYTNLAEAVLSAQKTGVDYDALVEDFATKVTSMRNRFDVLIDYNQKVDNIINEIVDMYKRNPEFNSLTDAERKEFVEEFEALLKQWNPNDPEFPTFVERMIDLLSGVVTDQVDEFKKAVINSDGIIVTQKSTRTWKDYIKPINAFKFIYSKFESHVFTSTFKSKIDWYNFMKDRPYLYPIRKNGKWSKYVLWWWWVKIAVPSVLGVVNIFVKLAQPSFNTEMKEYVDKYIWAETGSFRWFAQAFYRGIFIPMMDMIEEGFTKESENPDGTKIAENDPRTWNEWQREFSIIRTLLPTNVTLSFGAEIVENIMQYKYQSQANDYLRQAEEDLSNTVDSTNAEIQQGLRRVGIPNPLNGDSVDVETPEIDSTLLRQQEGPVVTGPSDGRGDVIDAYNIGNPNDKVTNYNPNTGEATYKGKKGKIARGANGDLLFISDDYQTVKNFGQ